MKHVSKFTCICFGILVSICLGLFIIREDSNCSMVEYELLKKYEYSQKLLDGSKEINNSLLADVKIFVDRFTKEHKEITPQDKRNLANEFFIKHSLDVETNCKIEDFSIENKDDKYLIPVRLYLPKKETKGLILFVHGGGWMQGNLDTHDYLCRRMADKLDLKILAVDYRLAPEHIFPKGLEDVESVYKWCMESEYSHKILGTVDKIYISGDSGGGNLSAALNLKLQKDSWGGHLPDGLILFYPALSNDIKSQSFQLFKDQAALSAKGTIGFIEQYVGAKIDDPKIANNELMFPIYGKAEAYPKTIIVAAGSDVLLDGQIALFNKLKEKNRNVKLFVVDGAIHGFMTYGKEFDDIVKAALQKIKEYIH